MLGKHYIVTGGTSGLGLEITKRLIKKGAHVTILARNKEKYKQINFKPFEKRVQMLTCDLQDKNAISMLPQYIDTQIDGIIYSAGLGYFKSISQHSTNEMLETYEVNIIGFNLLLHALLPYLSKHASIVGISSQAAFITQANAAYYGASKAAFNAVLNALRLEHPSYHVMLVNPGPVRTPFHEKADPSLAYAHKYDAMMLDPTLLAKDIIDGIIKRKCEINQPKWMHSALKFYQLCPRFLESLFPFLFKNKQ